ncbi:MAG TPA: GH116 family glycosyl hydrolase, partial [Caldilineaceae bacterium]|nr:GH116 family glycosyl hydrolase [Caldilineaceae bacterium]
HNQGLLAAHLRIAPGESRTIRFVISWSFPNCENYWKPPKTQVIEVADFHGESEVTPPKPTWKNYYATIWPDALASAEYALTQWDRLAAETQLYHDALFGSDLPPAALDAVSANISILKSPTVLRLEDGTFYGWEGCHPGEGCCEGSCTHVWNYAQALPFLFPKLERSMRTADYRYNLRPDGGMPFRLQLPIGSGLWQFRACADGQFGGVLKTYRDWKISGDREWLRSLWPAIKQSIDFAWSPTNEDRWDPEKTGVLWGRQHHTLDMELFGPNSWLTSLYLGALKAGAEMAEHLGDTAAAAEYRAL